jgi:uncharacterized circularly permuted ATP-grasp superfamily protein/uncharacterized alpha-E superfamily protein
MNPHPTSAQAVLPLEGAAAGADAALDTLLRRALPPEPGVWDELRAGTVAGTTGMPVPGGPAVSARWRRFAAWLPAPAPGLDITDELDRRVAQVAHQIRQDGVTHNVFSDTGVASRPWSLELLPLIVEPAEWAQIASGVEQRAALLERVLADLYGPQRLLHEGLLPPALLMRHPGWVRALHGVVPPAGRFLTIVAFDLARGPDGRWWVVAQRTQGPSGLGYVLHNRLIVARQFPDAFRELRVQHIASSYRRLLESVEHRAAALARAAGDGATPRIVLLTPGPYSETYFEHAYLARYLGLPLVEGGDLTVRRERLFLKTVEGLEPVHGVLRRLDDDFCDPLELRPDSALGVPGLLQAARAGSVVMANALGSAFLESPAVQGFLPGVSERLLGEPLVLPALPTWWCGEAAAREDVLPRLAEGMVLRSTFPRGGRTSQVHPTDAAAIGADPDAWTVQGRLRFSRAPIWGGGVLAPRPAMVRVYAIADAAGAWHVLPGGMTRVARREDMSVSMQRGGSSLDTWVLTDGPVDTFSMLPQRLSVDDIRARRRPVASRTGENLFWLGRYTERTEQRVRLARATLAVVDADNDASDAVLLALSQLAVATGLAPPGVPTLVQAPHLFERAVLATLGDATGAFSLAYDLRAMERAGAGLRERLSSEQWNLLRGMPEAFESAIEAPEGALPTLPQVMPALDRLALQLAAVTGAQTDRMTRDHGWRLLTVGRLLERLQGLALRLRAFLATGAVATPAGVELLLELFDSAITFRARYQRHEDLLAVADLLVFDDSNPRAFAGVLRRLRTELKKLPGGADAAAPLLARLPAEGAGIHLDELRGAGDVALAQRLLAQAEALSAVAAALADEVGTRFFTLAHGADRSV